MADKKPRGYIDLVLFCDAETTGLAFDNPIDPTRSLDGKTTFQAVSFGFVVTNAHTFEPIEKLYVEIKWNGESEWTAGAEKVHGLSLKYLEENGMDEEDAVVEIASLILKYWGPDSPVCLGGHNVATFDKLFLNDLMRRHGVDVRFGSKTVDTNAVGLVTFGTHNSDDLFETVGLPKRAEHNALVDADNAREACKRIRKMFDVAIGA